MSLLLLILSVATVSAADLDNDADLMGNEESFSLNSIEIQDSNDLNTSAGTFDDLQVEINNAPEGSVLNLTTDFNGHKGSRIQLNKDLTIDGQGHTLNCLGESGCSAFYSSSGFITLKNLKIINGHNDDTNRGGAIYISGSAQYTIDNCTFENNWADDYGGAIYNDVDKPLIIKNCQFLSNKADDIDGGAVYSLGRVSVANSFFKDNWANKNGGAIYASGNVELDNCIVQSNKADDEDAGAIYSGGSVSVLESIFKSNKANSMGGAIYANDEVNVFNSTFEGNVGSYGGAIRGHEVCVNSRQDPSHPYSFFINNKASDDGGGAIFALKDVRVLDSFFLGNSADIDGGAIYTVYDTYLSNCIFVSNKADGADVFQCYGGAVCAKDDINIDNCTFMDNYAYDYGGAVYGDTIRINSNSPTQQFTSFFINNKAKDNDGGAVYAYCDFYASNTLFSGNTAYEDGGAVFCCDNAYITNCLFESSTAKGALISLCEGGAIHCKDDLTVDNCTFNKNYASDYGGAIYADTLALRGHSYFDSNTAHENQGGAIWVNKFREDVKYAIFSNNIASKGASDDGGAIYIDNENHITFSQCAFINNSCGDEGGAIYLDSASSHLTLKNNYFLGNKSFVDFLSLFNCGYYDKITDNWWGDNKPSKKNDLLIEWKVWPWSNIHHVDSNPVYLKLNLIDDVCNVGGSVWAQACFYHSNDGSWCDGVMYTDLISFPTTTVDCIFYNRVDHEFYVNTLVSPQKSGCYVITANLLGQLSFAVLTVFDNYQFTSLKNENNLIPMADNYNNAVAINNVLTEKIESSNNSSGTDEANYQSRSDDSSIGEDNQSNSNLPVKSISQSKTILNNNNLYFLLFIVLMVILGGFLIKKMKK